MRLPLALVSLTVLSLAAPAATAATELGPRPAWLVGQMEDGPLKEKLEACLGQPAKPTLFSIAHRGAPSSSPNTRKKAIARPRRWAQASRNAM